MHVWARPHTTHSHCVFAIACLPDIATQAATWPIYEHLFERFAIHRRPKTATEPQTAQSPSANADVV